MKLTTVVSAFAISALMMGGVAYAVEAAPAAKAMAPAAKPMAPAAPMAAGTHSAKSVECSKEADAKGLHGKERKKFREECKSAK